jgi:hypothetical protein
METACAFINITGIQTMNKSRLILDLVADYQRSQKGNINQQLVDIDLLG